jgi:hypothetical protein
MALYFQKCFPYANLTNCKLFYSGRWQVGNTNYDSTTYHRLIFLFDASLRTFEKISKFDQLYYELTLATKCPTFNFQGLIWLTLDWLEAKPSHLHLKGCYVFYFHQFKILKQILINKRAKQHQIIFLMLYKCLCHGKKKCDVSFCFKHLCKKYTHWCLI